MQDFLYLNFYTIGSAIPTAFTAIGAVFIFSIKKRSKASTSLGWMMVYLTIFHLGYVFASSLYHPIGSYHRLLTGISILFAVVYITRFFFYFPHEKSPKIGKIIYYSMSVVAILHGIYFTTAVFSAEHIFYFESHYWDFFMPTPSKVVAYFIMIFVLAMITTGIWKIIVTPGRDRWVMLALFFFFFISTVPPGILNTMSREGVIAHSVYINSYDILVVVALFSVIILYINNTGDRTSFMAKIIGISMVAFLLTMQAVNYLMMIEKENFYDEKTRNLAIRAVLDDTHSPDLLYLNRLDVQKQSIRELYRKTSISIDTPAYQDEYLIAHYMNSFQNLSGDEARVEKFLENIRKLEKKSPAYFRGYVYTIEDFIKKENNPEPGKNIQSEITRIVFSQYRKIYYLKNKIAGVSLTGDWQKNVILVLEKNGKDLPGFQKAIREYLGSASPGTSTENLRKETLRYLTPLKSPEERHYRKDPTGQTHFIAFIVTHPREKEIYEAGFSYVAYRQYIHDTATNLFWLLTAITLLGTLGFPVIYYRTIIYPLNILLSGVKMVNQGNLELAIPVMVQDEMGFLSESFNSMVLSIKNSKTKLQDYADNLEDMVDERTNELKKRLDEINQLKSQQDGDYFLTSLLINPLSTNLVKSENVTVEFLLKQKKQFSFRKWTREIGGDLCVAHSIFLRDKPYTVVLNADAMGKSMQGAGGILVLGSVFQTIIDRTLNIPLEKSKYPEIWIKYAMIELHKVFLSFDGSMLVSMVMGLIDDENGIMYFINAEHPFSILYRDGKAEFIENEETLFRKLGTTLTKGNVAIQLYPLKDRDYIIIGSDGRDDIILKENGEINEDENQILRIVEKNRADLQKMYEEITQTGNLMDDLSLLKIQYVEKKADPVKRIKNQQLVVELNQLKNNLQNYSEDQKSESLSRINEFEKKYPDLAEAQKMIIRFYLKYKMYDRAVNVLEKYTHNNPMETDHIYLYSFVLKKIKKYEEAATMGERVRIRNPENLVNLVNLAEVYYRLKNSARAASIIKDVLVLEKNNERANALYSIINRDIV